MWPRQPTEEAGSWQAQESGDRTMSTCWEHRIDEMAGGRRVQTYLFRWRGRGQTTLHFTGVWHSETPENGCFPTRRGCPAVHHEHMLMACLLRPRGGLSVVPFLTLRRPVLRIPVGGPRRRVHGCPQQYPTVCLTDVKKRDRSNASVGEMVSV